MLRENRLKLHSKLIDILGSNNVYYQPPANVRMNYPAIVYKRKNTDPIKADNITYLPRLSYTITVISTDPDIDAVERLINMPYTKYTNSYVSENLYHYIFNTYF